MRKEWKMICRVLMVVAALALATSAANAQSGFKPRTLSLNCNNLGSNSSTVTSWAWTDGAGNPLVTPTGFTVPTGTFCTGDATTSVTINQPLTDDGGTAILGVAYTVTFTDTIACPATDFIRAFGDLLRFRDKCADSGKNADVVVRVAN